jgi:hypothetical protein
VWKQGLHVFRVSWGVVNNNDDGDEGGDGIDNYII